MGQPAACDLHITTSGKPSMSIGFRSPTTTFVFHWFSCDFANAKIFWFSNQSDMDWVDFLPWFTDRDMSFPVVRVDRVVRLYQPLERYVSGTNYECRGKTLETEFSSPEPNAIEPNKELLRR
jgi:hypothetical protein